MRSSRRVIIPLLGVLSALLVAGPARAVDGVIEINQAKALAGGITSYDTPGFPVSIVSSPGSYRLTSNLDVPDADTAGILVSAFQGDVDVTIDLNGFSIRGPVECSKEDNVTTCSTSGSGSGITVGSYGVALTITNGAIRGMGLDGVHAAFTDTRTRIHNVTAVSNGGDGFSVRLAQITDSRAELNKENGVSALESGALITDCVLHDNGNLGIQATTGVGIGGNTLHGNDAGAYVGGVLIAPNLCGTGLCGP